jgi:hypothetical protein
MATIRKAAIEFLADEDDNNQRNISQDMKE